MTLILSERNRVRLVHDGEVLVATQAPNGTIAWHSDTNDRCEVMRLFSSAPARVYARPQRRRLRVPL